MSPVVSRSPIRVLTSSDFQENNGEDCDNLSTLVYVTDPESFIKMTIQRRKIAKPFASLGWDGGKDKLLLVLQIHDLENPDPALWKDGGRRRSIILARGKGSVCFITL